MIQFNEEGQDKKIHELHQKEEAELAKVLSQKYGLKYTDLSVVSINTDALRIIPEETARDAKMVAFDIIGKELKVAVVSPNNPKTKEVLEGLAPKYKAVVYMVSTKSLIYAWARYEDLSFATATREGALDISGERIEEFLSKVRTLPEVQSAIKDSLTLGEVKHISQVIEVILAGALSLKASDVHLEAEEDHVRLRYRLDGMLTEILNFPHDLYKYVLSRIKLLSGVKLNLKEVAQDGRFSIGVGDQQIEIRTSVVPGGYGESVVMRVLNPDSIAVGIEALGMHPIIMEILEKEIMRPNGLLLNTGPTGSGKTTTLYAFLKKIHRSDVKIITIEDPIEYHLPGIVQTQTTEDYSFAQGLRAALRQDPDVMLVGEIRDSETAEIAINASLTGHLVFSTLHTNNAAGTFPRLIDLGVDPKVLAPAMNATMAQRLVRKLCEKCKKPSELAPEEKALIEKVVAGIPRPDFVPKEWSIFEAVGCTECGNTGYKGRIGIFELILVNESMEEVIGISSSEREIRQAAREIQKLPSMEEDGVIKILSGVTTLSEIKRVVDLEKESE